MEVIDFHNVTVDMLVKQLKVVANSLIEEDFGIRSRYIISTVNNKGEMIDELGYLDFVIISDFEDSRIATQGLQCFSQESMNAYKRFRLSYSLDKKDSGRVRVAIFEEISIHPKIRDEKVMEKVLFIIMDMLMIGGVNTVVFDCDSVKKRDNFLQSPDLQTFLVQLLNERVTTTFTNKAVVL